MFYSLILHKRLFQRILILFLMLLFIVNVFCFWIVSIMKMPSSRNWGTSMVQPMVTVGRRVQVNRCKSFPSSHLLSALFAMLIGGTSSGNLLWFKPLKCGALSSLETLQWIDKLSPSVWILRGFVRNTYQTVEDGCSCNHITWAPGI